MIVDDHAASVYNSFVANELLDEVSESGLMVAVNIYHKVIWSYLLCMLNLQL